MMTPGVDDLRGAGLISSLDLAVAEMLGRLSGGVAAPAARLAAALVSRARRQGHVCLELGRFAETPICDDRGDPVGGWVYPALADWLQELSESGFAGPEASGLPLVLDDRGRLFLRRYWACEVALASVLRTRAATGSDDIDAELLRRGLDRLFGEPSQELGEVDWQREAARRAVERRFCVISGGPGTGKTSTVVKILALLVEQAQHRGEPAPRTLLLAPTGKAAARLTESIRTAKQRMDGEGGRLDAIPEEASTIHRAIGLSGRSGRGPRHDADNPLSTDLVLVDEASMVDLVLMSQLVSAVPPSARLILLGDRNQLASVEAGSVLTDLCATALPETSPTVEAGRDFSSAVVTLQRSYRFGADSGVGRLARAVLAGDEGAVKTVLSGADPSVSLLPVDERGAPGALLQRRVIAWFRAVVDAGDVDSQLHAFDAFRLLAAHRRGTAGVEGLNAWAERTLSTAGLIRPSEEWYPRRPIMVTENVPSIGLFNGDVGLIVDDPDIGRCAAFRASDGGVRTISTARLPQHETLYAMTVHKSQGSEFDEVALVLPARPSPVLTRELIYTGITRARTSVVIFARDQVLQAGIGARVARMSGLRDHLQQS